MNREYAKFEIGTHCVGGTGCKNAFLLSTTFGSYGVTITP